MEDRDGHKHPIFSKAMPIEKIQSELLSHRLRQVEQSVKRLMPKKVKVRDQIVAFSMPKPAAPRRSSS